MSRRAPTTNDNIDYLEYREVAKWGLDNGRPGDAVLAALALTGGDRASREIARRAFRDALKSWGRSNDKR